jgi:hypothetical protein
VTASFLCAGQSCTAGELFLVHEAVHDEFLDKLTARIADVRLGDPFDEATTMGPLNNEPVEAKMDEHVVDALLRAAELVAGGRPGLRLPDLAVLRADRARPRQRRDRRRARGDFRSDRPNPDDPERRGGAGGDFAECARAGWVLKTIVVDLS